MSSVFYQTDSDGVLLFATQPYEYKPGGAVAVEPPAVPAGKLALWDTTIDPNADATFGDAGTGAWVIKDDHRNDDLFTADGKYEIKSDYNGQSYGGIGALPAWLSLTEPPKPEPTLDELKAAKLVEINTKAQAAIAPYTKGYPQFEIDTWPVQSSEAAAYAIDASAPTPFCDIAAAQRGIDRVEFIGRVQAKVALFTQLSATVAGYRQGLEDQITAITDPETGPDALSAIVWVSPV